MDDWSYVALAYTAVWGTVACYAVLLQRRITRSRAGVQRTRQTTDEFRSRARQEEPACDLVSAP